MKIVRNLHNTTDAIVASRTSVGITVVQLRLVSTGARMGSSLRRSVIKDTILVHHSRLITTVAVKVKTRLKLDFHLTGVPTVDI